jgi:cytochrome P450
VNTGERSDAADTGVAAPGGVDLLDPAFWAGDPEPYLARLRHEAPVCRHDASGLWALARHADVMAVSREPATFCSGRGVLPADRQRSISGTDSILYLDPPEHQRHRRLASPAFTPKRVDALVPRIRELATDLVDRIEPSTAFEAVDALAVPLPLLVIAELLGVPAADRERFRRWSDAMIAVASHPADDDFVLAAELWGYFGEVIAARRRSPRDDLVSVLVSSSVDGELLDEAELQGFCMTLLVAGNETTRNLIAGGLLAFAGDPDAWRRLQADAGLVPSAVEEMLRWVTPITAFARTATRDVELGGETIAAGDYVLLLYRSANRDEDVFGPTAGSFDVGRTPNPHVAFGFGEHFCLGASLARAEARVLLEVLLSRFGPPELVGDPVAVPSNLMHGLARLPLLFTA